MSDRRWMLEAARLGEAARGRTAPNPNVGCLIVKDGEIVGRGATAPGGRPHAEAVALAEAGQQGQAARRSTPRWNPAPMPASAGRPAPT